MTMINPDLPDRPDPLPLDGDLHVCGRTQVHRRHETTEGWCPGLDGTEVPPPPGLLARLRSALTGGGA